MKNNLITVLIFALAGLVIGYLFFGKINDQYVSLVTLIKPASNDFAALGQKITGITKVRNHIAICGGLGLLVGILIRIFKK